MDKALFNKKYGLQSAVLEGRKEQTRRICRNQVNPSIEEAKWKVGEEVAVAQSYSDVVKGFHEKKHNQGYFFDAVEDRAGWNNMMFVKPALMPHRIKITNVRVERLQDISNEDCLKEGIRKVNYDTFVVDGIYVYDNGKEDGHYLFDTPREAFATLIDKVSGKGTWESNPWVFVYDFELVR